jgi:carbon-monoxide dehydrogenase catalytic subunit
VPPPIGGSAAVSKFFYEDTQETLGAAMVVRVAPAELVAKLIDDLDQRRLAQGWPV